MRPEAAAHISNYRRSRAQYQESTRCEVPIEWPHCYESDASGPVEEVQIVADVSAALPRLRRVLRIRLRYAEMVCRMAVFQDMNVIVLASEGRLDFRLCGFMRTRVRLQKNNRSVILDYVPAPHATSKSRPSTSILRTSSLSGGVTFFL